MIGLGVVVRQVGGVQEAELRHWIALSWVRPGGSADEPVFHEVDVARVRLIVELRRDLGVNDEAVPVVLSLLDQLYRERDRQRRLRDALVEVVPRVGLERLLSLLSDTTVPDSNDVTP